MMTQKIFFILSGTQQVLTEGAGGMEWRDATAGDSVQVTGGMPHAHRNISDEPAIELVITTARLGRFFREIARPITSSPQPPTPDEFDRFAAVAAQHTRGKRGGRDRHTRFHSKRG
jgi:uncharacterized RmlC-like cupin family protein